MGALTIAIACVSSPADAQQSEQRVSREDGRTLAMRLNDLGQPSAAREIALGLLRADPRDVIALIALARAELSLGRKDAAERAAQAANSAAETPAEKFRASLVIAEIFAQTDRFSRSQIWLRRAQNFASNDSETRLVENAYNNVRNLNPLTVHLSFGLMPSSNVNSGTSNDTVTFAYLPGVFGTIPWVVPADERPLSGFQISGDVNLRYRLAQSERFQTTLDFGLYAHTYVLSESARDAAPDITGSSLAYGDLSIGIGHQWVPEGSATRQYGASLTFKRSFTTDGALSDRVIGDISLDQLVGETDRLSFGLTLENEEYHNSTVTSQSAGVRAQWVHAFDEGRSLTTAITLSDQQSNDINRDFSSASFALTYGFGEILPQIDVSTTLQTEWRTFDTVSLDPTGRDDFTTTLNIQAGIGSFDFYGFEPVVALRAQRNDSSVPSYDTETVTLGLNFRSSF